jgi:hypothetical protein
MKIPERILHPKIHEFSRDFNLKIAEKNLNDFK